MSNALSIATVTAVIKSLLENGLVSDAIAASVGDVLVTALPPDKIQVGSDERAQINLFLYHVTQNRNVDWISQEYRSRYTSNTNSTNPPLALDLHYVLTAYGAKDFQAEILLGYVMQMLHKIPIVLSDTIESALKNSEASRGSVFSQAITGLSVSKLAEQIGQIKLSPEFLNMEESSKIWSALQTHYRPSATYQASMVLIESGNIDKSKVGSVLVSNQPSIEQVTAPPQGETNITVGSTLLIRGKRLQGDITKVRLGNQEKFCTAFDVQNTQVSLQVPPDLRVGVQSVQIVHQTMEIGGHSNLIESNVAAFVLHPKIIDQTRYIKSNEDSKDNLSSGEISIKCNPKIGKEQRVILLLNEILSENPLFYSFPIAARATDTDTIATSIKNVKPGVYLVRIQVDGATSILYKNKNGEYDSPQVTIS